MIRRLIYLVCFILASTNCFADDEATTLTVTMTNGEQTHYALWEVPTVKIIGDKLQIRWNNTNVEHPIENVKTFTFNSTLNIDEISQNADFERHNDYLIFHSSDSKRTLTITAANGLTIVSKTIEPNRSEIVSLGNLTPGVYLLSINGVTSKIIKQ